MLTHSESEHGDVIRGVQPRVRLRHVVGALEVMPPLLGHLGDGRRCHL